MKAYREYWIIQMPYIVTIYWAGGRAKNIWGPHASVGGGWADNILDAYHFPSKAAAERSKASKEEGARVRLIRESIDDV